MSFLDSLINSLSSSAKSTLNSTVNNAISSAKSGAKSAVNKAVSNAGNAIKKAIETKSKTFTFASLPTTVDELKALQGGDMKEPFASAAMTVLALNMYYTNKEAGIAAFDYVMGPDALSNLAISGIDMSIMQNGDKVAMSYFEGATPDNNYQPRTPYTLKVYEYSNSKDVYEDGYYRLFVKSGGADSERQITLRNKKSTGEWFATEFASLYMGIKQGKEEDPWA